MKVTQHAIESLVESKLADFKSADYSLFPNLKRKGLFQLRNSPILYPTLFHLVPWHFGQGGSVSVLSSNLITSPQFRHLYRPFPGFSPVVYIIEKI